MRGVPVADVIADVELIRHEPPATIPGRMGMSAVAISRALYRSGRLDLLPLARALRAVDRAERPDAYRAWDRAAEARRRGSRPSGPARRDASLRGAA